MPQSPARRRDHRTARTVGPSSAVACRMAAGLVVAAATIAAAGVRAAPAGLETEIRAAWDGVPMRDWAARISVATGVPVVVDPRLDPGRRVTLTSDGETARGILDRVAAELGAAVEPCGTVIRLVPRAHAGRAAAAAAVRARDVQRLPAAIRRRAEQPAAWAWNAAARPRDLVADAADAAGITLSGLDRIPHDHLPAASLPPLPLADRLDLLLAGYDLRIDWSPAGAAIVPLEPGRAADEPAGVATAPLDRRGPGQPRPQSEPKTVYSLRLAAPLDQAVAAVAKGVGLDAALDEASLAARGIAAGEIVRVDARDLSRDELLDALVAPLGLSWRVDGGTLRVFAAPVESGRPRADPDRP